MTHSKLTKALSRYGEEQLIKAGQRILLDGGYPNPDRVGCPGREVLKGLAWRKRTIREAEDWIIHIGGCSPCFREYTAFQKRQARRNVFEFALAAAAVLVLAIIAGWVWKPQWFIRPRPNVAAMPPQRATIDLRNRLVFRDDAPTSQNSGPIQLERGSLELTMLLSAGNKPGSYEVQVFRIAEKPLAIISGTAVNRDGVTALNVKLDLSRLSPGTYILRLSPSKGEASEYPLIIE